MKATRRELRYDAAKQELNAGANVEVGVGSGIEPFETINSHPIELLGVKLDIRLHRDPRPIDASAP